jgi:pyrroloquinoline quinone (PQQ) biosynthesis protein C
MIANELKTRIESYAGLLQLARQGKVTPDIVTAYLSGVLFMIRQTPVHLQLAKRRASALGREDMAAFFEHKQTEERDHDRWAVDDIGSLQRLFGTASAQPPDANMVALAGFVESAITRQPASYLAYILLTEYLTVLVGPAWLSALEERCGIPRTALSVVSKHVELDQDHVAEGLRELDALLTDADRPALNEMLDRATDHYDAFYDAIYALRDRPSAAHAAG